MRQKTKDLIWYWVFSFVVWVGLVSLIMTTGCSLCLAIWIAIVPLLICEFTFLLCRSWLRNRQ